MFFLSISRVSSKYPPTYLYVGAYLSIQYSISIYSLYICNNIPVLPADTQATAAYRASSTNTPATGTTTTRSATPPPLQGTGTRGTTRVRLAAPPERPERTVKRGGQSWRRQLAWITWIGAPLAATVTLRPILQPGRVHPGAVRGAAGARTAPRDGPPPLCRCRQVKRTVPPWNHLRTYEYIYQRCWEQHTVHILCLMTSGPITTVN